MITHGSMDGLFGDFFREFWRVILGGVRYYLGVDFGRFLVEKERKDQGNIEEHYPEQVTNNSKYSIKSLQIVYLTSVVYHILPRIVV